MGKKRVPLSEMHQNMMFDVDEIDENIDKKEDNNKNSFSVPKEGFVELPLSEVELDKNIRDIYADDDLEELGDSILENGQIQPIVVTPRNGKYIVKVGHRRYKACLLRDVEKIKCIIEDEFKDEKERIIIQAIENEQRLNLSSREREAYIARLIDLGMAQNEIAKALHKTKGWVSEALTSYKFANENKDLLDGLSEEPSTRDLWKAKNLSKQEFESAVEAAKMNGGSKEAFKEEVSKKYEQNKMSRKRRSSNINSVTCTIQLDHRKEEASVEMTKCFDDDLAEIILKEVKKYYQNLGFDIKE